MQETISFTRLKKKGFRAVFDTTVNCHFTYDGDFRVPSAREAFLKTVDDLIKKIWNR